MTLSQIRRVLIAVIVCLLLVVGGLLAYISHTNKANDPATAIYKVVGVTRNKKAAEVAKMGLVNRQFKVSVSEEKYEFSEPNGYRLELRLEEGLLKQFQESLKQHNVSSSIKQDDAGHYLQTGGNYQSKAEAETAAKQCSEKSGIGIKFAVAQEYKKLSKPAYRLRVTDVPGDKLDEAKGVLNKNKFVDVSSSVSGKKDKAGAAK